MTMAVGHIVHADQAEAILREGRADLTALAREIMYNPNWPMDAAQKLGADPNFDLVPPPYSYWLGQRAQPALEGRPSTWAAGLEDPAAPEVLVRSASLQQNKQREIERGFRESQNPALGVF